MNKLFFWGIIFVLGCGLVIGIEEAISQTVDEPDATGLEDWDFRTTVNVSCWNLTDDVYQPRAVKSPTDVCGSLGRGSVTVISTGWRGIVTGAAVDADPICEIGVGLARSGYHSMEWTGLPDCDHFVKSKVWGEAQGVVNLPAGDSAGELVTRGVFEHNIGGPYELNLGIAASTGPAAGLSVAISFGPGSVGTTIPITYNGESSYEDSDSIGLKRDKECIGFYEHNVVHHVHGRVEADGNVYLLSPAMMNMAGASRFQQEYELLNGCPP